MEYVKIPEMIIMKDNEQSAITEVLCLGKSDAEKISLEAMSTSFNAVDSALWLMSNHPSVGIKIIASYIVDKHSDFIKTVFMATVVDEIDAVKQHVLDSNMDGETKEFNIHMIDQICKYLSEGKIISMEDQKILKMKLGKEGGGIV